MKKSQWLIHFGFRATDIDGGEQEIYNIGWLEDLGGMSPPFLIKEDPPTLPLRLFSTVRTRRKERVSGGYINTKLIRFAKCF